MDSKDEKYLENRSNTKSKEEEEEVFKLLVLRGMNNSAEIARAIHGEENINEKDISKKSNKVRSKKSNLCNRFLGKSKEPGKNRFWELVRYMMANDYNLVHPRLRKEYKELHGDDDFESENIGTLLERYLPDSFPLKARTKNRDIVTLINYLDENFWNGDNSLYKIKGSQNTGEITDEMKVFIQLCEDRGVAEVIKIDFEHSINSTITNNAGLLMNWYINELYKQIDSEDEIENKATRKVSIDEDPGGGSHEYTKKVIEKMEGEKEFGSEDNFLLIIIENIDKLFDNLDIANIFYHYLKIVFEDTKLKKRIRLVIPYSTDYYLKIDDLHSPFDIGETLTICGLDLENIKQLLEANEVDLSEQDIKTLFNWMGGSLYLWQVTIGYFKESELEVEKFKKRAIVDSKFQDFLCGIRKNIEQDEQLEQLEQLLDSIIKLREPNAFLERSERKLYHVLEELRVIKIDEDHRESNKWSKWIISCEMYEEFFKKHLAEKADRSSTTVSVKLPKEFPVYVGRSFLSYPAPGYDQEVRLIFNEPVLSTFDMEDSTFYVKEEIVSIARDGYVPRSLKTVNEYMGEDGGYIGVYTHERKKGICHVGGGIYLIGQIRLKGKYNNERIFEPETYEGRDISAVPYFIDLCNKHFPSEGGSWAGGDTYGWFKGITESE